MGTRITGGGAEKVYAAAGKWVERALRADDSLFTPGKAIWSSRWLGELHERFLNHPDESSDSFLEKLQQQLADSPPEVYQLMGEVLYFYFLIVTTRDSANEQLVIDTVLGWSPSPAEIPQELVASLTPGIASPGQYFHTSRPFQVGFLIEFVEQWKEQRPDEQRLLLADPWEFKGFVMRLNFRSALLQGHPNRPRTQREALLHLAFPDTFEAIVSFDHKEKIARTFAKFVVAPEEDVDLRLEQIRPGLEAQYGSSNYFFYKPEIHDQWTGNGNGVKNPEPVDSIEQACSNVERFNDSIEKREGLEETLRQFRHWYYCPWIDKVGPSKFIGYRGMTGLKYMEDANSLDGRETQGVLRKLFERLGEGTPEYRCVRQKVVDLSHKYGKSPNETATFSAPREWRVSMGKASATTTRGGNGDSDIRMQWNPWLRNWDEFVRRAKEYAGSGRLQTEEIDYKLQMNEDLTVARNAVLAGRGDWHDLLKYALRSRTGHPVAWPLLSDFNKWCVDYSEEALSALQVLWAQDDTSVAERIRAFSSRFPRSAVRGAVGNRTNVISVLLMGVDVEQFPPYRVGVFNEAYDRTQYGLPERGTDEAEVYEHALGFLDRFIDEAAERELELRHRLDAQSLVWQVKYLEEDEQDEQEEGGDSQSNEIDLGALANELHLTVEFLENIQMLLNDKRQVVFQGPPGTGKTHQELCRGSEHGAIRKAIWGWPGQPAKLVVAIHCR